MRFVVEGIMDQGSEKRKFSKDVEAPSERQARELAFSLLGSAHGIIRSKITITQVRKAEG